MGETMWQMKVRGRDVRAWAGLPLTAVASLLLVVSRGVSRARADPAHARGPAKPVAAGGKAKLTATLTSAGKPRERQARLVPLGHDGDRQGDHRLQGPGHQADEKLTAPATFVARFTPAGADAAAYTHPRARPSRLRRGRAHRSASTPISARAGAPSESPTRPCACAAPWRRYVAGAGVELSVFRGPRRVLHETRRVTAS